MFCMSEVISMVAVICFLLFISLVVLAIFSEVEKLNRTFALLCNILSRMEYKNDEEE